MIVDDSVKNPRKKRESLLNPDFKYIGISASDYNNSLTNENNIILNTNNENIIEKNNEGNIKDENVVVNKDEKININIKSDIKRKAFCGYFSLK